MTAESRERTDTTGDDPVWIVATLAGLCFILLLQLDTPVKDISDEYLYPEIASRMFGMAGLILCLIWSLHLRRTEGLPTIASLRTSGLNYHRSRWFLDPRWYLPLLPYLLSVSFAALVFFENNWDLTVRDQLWGRALAGFTMLPLFLVPVAWYTRSMPVSASRKRRSGLLLSTGALLLLAFSQILDYHHDNHTGIRILRDLATQEGIEEGLEFFSLIALFKSVFMLSAQEDTDVDRFVKGVHWRRFLIGIAVSSTGNGMLMGTTWNGTMATIRFAGVSFGVQWATFHLIGAALMLIGAGFAVREVRDFLSESAVERARSTQCADT